MMVQSKKKKRWKQIAVLIPSHFVPKNAYLILTKGISASELPPPAVTDEAQKPNRNAIVLYNRIL
jgi:hypothetical protein